MKMELRSRAVDKVYKRRDRIDMPDFQREEVWPPEKKRRLIDTILRGWHLPKFYLRAVEDGDFECVDGQQRLVAIWEFFEDKLSLADDTARLVGGRKYSELPDAISDTFDDYEIDIEEIEDASDEELEELFLRLQFGTPLNAAEKLNAIGGEMKEFCQDVAQQPFFRTKLPIRDTRYSHFEIATKLMFVESRGIQPQMRFPQLEALLKDNRAYSRKSDTARRVMAAMAYLDQAFPTSAKSLRNRANTLSIGMLACRIVERGLGAGTAKEFGRFVEEFLAQLSVEVEKGSQSTEKELIAYQQAISYGSTGGDSIRTRQDILLKRLATFSPVFSSLLGGSQGAADAASEAIRNEGTRLQSVILNVNRRHAAIHGEDLFKMTTESTAGAHRLARPCRDASSFGELVDGLYFLIYEGSGSCNRLPKPVPEFAMDVKHLRTLLRHDVDHGGAKEAAKKRQRNAAVFKKYSGKSALGDCGPEEFIAAQARILSALDQFLRTLP